MSKFKVILVGEVNVGKTSLLLKYAKNQFHDKCPPDVEYEEMNVDVEGHAVTLRIFDTAGQECFRTITSSYYHGSDAVILVYDITQKETFLKIEGWMSDIQLYGKDRVPKVLVGNKLDLEERREVSVNEAQELQSKADVKVILEASALTGQNVERVFTEIARQLISDKLAEQPQAVVATPSRMNANAVASERKKKCNIL